MQYKTGKDIERVKVTDDGLTLFSKVYPYNGNQGLMGVVIHGEDGNDGAKGIRIGNDGSLYTASAGTDEIFSVSKILTAAGQDILVDLSDTVSYPHKNIGRVDVKNIVVSLKSTADTDVAVGYFDGITYRSMTHYWVDASANNTAFHYQDNFSGASYRCSNIFTKADTATVTAIAGIGKGDLWYRLSATPTGGHVDVVVQYRTRETEATV